ncbi:acylphosphatase [Vibrio sp. SM6]|uniref:Acylphosphatase n=1 Tax=Vibrio agarilyticus TaxID=2726741 RepID=A0A7X8TPH5_9VIBR|nr:acylphosphatase [Vibrio agarilyticus]NLS12530.1 acylphosphatase [Vibrio agarilyticus]
MERMSEKFLVSGRVQGVGFRYHTCHHALKLGLTGYAKNLESGQVEVLACGSEEQLEHLAQWLSMGPKTASVTNVSRERVQLCSEFRGFEIR